MTLQQITIENCIDLHKRLGKSIVINDGKVLGFVQSPGFWVPVIRAGVIEGQVYCSG